MEFNVIPRTAQIPSGSGMPICGRTAPVTGATLLAGVPAMPAVSNRQVQAVVTGVTGDLRLPNLFPGTPAWSPPTS